MPDTVVAPPRVPVPPTKAAHKQSLFNSIKSLISVALSYTISYGDDPAERDFVHYLDDVIKTLPMDEESVSVCALLLFRKMVKRSEKNPVRVVEHVDEFLPAPKPVMMHCSDGTSTMVEQVKSSKLQLSSNTAFEFKGNTPALLPVPVPYTLTFTPDAATSKPGLVVPPISYVVLASGMVKERDEPLYFDVEDDELGNKKRGNSSPSGSPSVEPKPISVPTPSTNDSASVQAPISENATPTSIESVEAIAIPDVLKDKRKPKISRTLGTTTGVARKLRTSASTTTASIPFPSMSSSSRKYPPSVASAPHTAPSGEASSLPNHTDDFPFAVNHFPPHPLAADGRPVPGRRVPLQRSYAFTHKSHPEIFWNDAWGEKPTVGQTRAAEGCSQPPTDNQKGKKRSEQTARSNSPTRMPSSGSAMRAVMRLASVTKGKKRTREEVDVDVDEERPNQRRRSGGDDTPKRSSRRFSGLKKAVKSIAGSAFTN